jgi:hypothetical protein
VVDPTVALARKRARGVIAAGLAEAFDWIADEIDGVAELRAPGVDRADVARFLPGQCGCKRVKPQLRTCSKNSVVRVCPGSFLCPA